jgi:hypothetical protein
VGQDLHLDKYQNIVSSMTTFAVSVILKPTDKSVIFCARLDAQFRLLDHLLAPSTLPSLFTSAVFGSVTCPK